MYDDEGYMPDNEYNARRCSPAAPRKAEDGSITIHFGGDTKADNFLPLQYPHSTDLRMYNPGPEILDGSWKFPEPVEAK